MSDILASEQASKGGVCLEIDNSERLIRPLRFVP